MDAPIPIRGGAPKEEERNGAGVPLIVAAPGPGGLTGFFIRVGLPRFLAVGAAQFALVAAILGPALVAGQVLQGRRAQRAASEMSWNFQSEDAQAHRVGQPGGAGLDRFGVTPGESPGAAVPGSGETASADSADAASQASAAGAASAAAGADAGRASPDHSAGAAGSFAKIASLSGSNASGSVSASAGPSFMGSGRQAPQAAGAGPVTGFSGPAKVSRSGGPSGPGRGRVSNSYGRLRQLAAVGRRGGNAQAMSENLSAGWSGGEASGASVAGGEFSGIGEGGPASGAAGMAGGASTLSDTLETDVPEVDKEKEVTPYQKYVDMAKLLLKLAGILILIAWGCLMSKFPPAIAFAVKLALAAKYLAIGVLMCAAMIALSGESKQAVMFGVFGGLALWGAITFQGHIDAVIQEAAKKAGEEVTKKLAEDAMNQTMQNNFNSWGF